MTRTETLTIILPTTDLLNINGERQMHFRKRAKIVHALRAETAATAADVSPFIGRVRISLGIRWADKRLRDTSQNWSPTSKALVDGLVDAGVIPGDDDRYVAGVEAHPDLPHDGVRGYAALTLTIEGVE